MPLELATRLILRNAEDGSPADPERVREICANWAEVPEALAEDVDDAPGRNGAGVTTHTTLLEDRRMRWTCELRRTDDGDADVQWVADVGAVFDPDRTTVAVTLRRESHDQRLRPLQGAPKPPVALRALITTDGIDAYDGPLRVLAEAAELTAGNATGFVDTCLLAEDRRLPVIAIGADGPDHYPRLDGDGLARTLAGFAHVRRVRWEALAAVSAQLGPSLSVGQGSLRLWWPGLGVDDAPAIHPEWDLRFDDGTSATHALRSAVLEVSRDRWREPERMRHFARDARRTADAAGRAVAARLTEEVERLRAAASEASASTADVEQLAAVSRDVAAVQEELARQRDDAEYVRELYELSDAQRERAEADNWALRSRLNAAQSQIRALRSSGPAGLSLEDEFVALVRASYRSRLADADAAGPLEQIVIREEFLDSIVRSQASEDKVVDTVAEVACGLAPTLQGRQVHRMRTSSAGNSPDRVRPADGASAWRCSIQTNSPSARRLHYWVLPDGGFEFVSVVVHGDFRIAE